jgi:hypothetical protein
MQISSFKFESRSPRSYWIARNSSISTLPTYTFGGNNERVRHNSKGVSRQLPRGGESAIIFPNGDWDRLHFAA